MATIRAAYGVTSPEQEEQETVLVGSDDAQATQQTTQQDQAGIEQLSDTVDLISASVFAGHALENTAAEGENLQDGDNYENVESLQLDELQTFLRVRQENVGTTFTQMPWESLSCCTQQWGG
ncbi:hypothetical protein GQ600_15887 [Phytophthora cactorum]|nr:hypothetical protein GQ600_15887 [Phytophthora cactorum]